MNGPEECECGVYPPAYEDNKFVVQRPGADCTVTILKATPAAHLLQGISSSSCIIENEINRLERLSDPTDDTSNIPSKSTEFCEGCGRLLEFTIFVRPKKA